MAYNGSGTWVRLYSWTNDAANSINIRADRMDNEFNDMCNNGLSLVITKDGQQNPTANLPMATFRHTGVGAAVNLTDYARAQEVQNGAMTWGATAAGTANALTISPTPSILAYVNGQKFRFKTGTSANSGAATLAISGLAAIAINKGAGATALVTGDLPANTMVEVTYDSGNAAFVLTTLPVSSILTGTLLAANNLSDLASAATARTNLGLSAGATSGIVKIVKQPFPSSGPYTPTTGMAYCIIEAVGGGGSGGSCPAASTQSYGASGGGAGGYSRLLATAATIGASQVVTIGAAGAAPAAGGNNGNNGGQTSVGSLCVANGGNGGIRGDFAPAGGAGGGVGTGDIAASGAPGGTGISSSNNIVDGFSGAGGSGPFGGGGAGLGSVVSASNGNAGTGRGSGGSGATVSGSASTASGGAGTAGFVIITEFCTQ